jgi:hypothetical protein
MSPPTNPFTDLDARELWEMLVRRDIEGFLRQDWNLLAVDFLENAFVGLNACFEANPEKWKLTFPDLDSYRRAWLDQSRQFAGVAFLDDPRACLYAAMKLARIEVQDRSALVHKKFDGWIRQQTGEPLRLHWQSLFFCRKIDGAWKIGGFVGYLPNLECQAPPQA